jgi:hypothetical protein
MASNEDAQGGLDALREWNEEYGDLEYFDNTPENWALIQGMDPHFVWTDHSTCENSRVSCGAFMFENSCCWATFGWSVRTIPWEDGPGGQEDTYLSVDTSACLPCPTCNPDGEREDFDDEDDEECPGDEQFPNEECNDGFVNYYYD